MIEYLARTEAQEEARGRYEVEAAAKMKSLLADARDGMSDSARRRGEGLARKLAEEEARKKMAQSVGRLELQSILQGDVNSSAVISGQLVDEGQTVDGWAVVEIHNTEVVLQKQNYKHVLKIR